MNSENSKTSDHCRLLFNLSCKANIKRSDNVVFIKSWCQEGMIFCLVIFCIKYYRLFGVYHQKNVKQ